MKRAVAKGAVHCLGSCMRAIRPLLGPPGVCLYPVNCIVYTESMLLSKPLHKALALIAWRLVCCNPVTGIVRYLRKSA